MKNYIIGVRSFYTVVLFALTPAVAISNAATITIPAIGVGTFSDPNWDRSGSFSFNEPYARLQSVSYRFFGGATISNTISNPSSSNILGIASGSARFSLERNGQVIDSFTVSLRGSSIILPGKSLLVGDSNSQSKTGSLSLENSSGIFTVRSLGVSGPNLKTIGDFGVTYTYDPIGDTSDDPIMPTLSLDGVRNFSAIPSGRWFDMALGEPATIEATSTDTFRQFAANFMGGGGSYRLIANGVDLGLINSDKIVDLPAGTSKIEVSNVSGSMRSGKIVSSNSGSNFKIVPEPSSLLLLGLSGVLASSRRRCPFAA